MGAHFCAYLNPTSRPPRGDKATPRSTRAPDPSWQREAAKAKQLERFRRARARKAEVRNAGK